jgi:tetratricopeptide (TPR) repeat protein
MMSNTARCLLLCLSLFSPAGFALAQEPVNQSYSQGGSTANEADARSSADIEYENGLALARLQHWDEASGVFLSGRRRWPRDKRFPVELAGIAFKQKNYSHAAAWLHEALRLDPQDAYANEFLATIYFLQGNLEAALKYWNRIEKPRIDEVRTNPTPRTNPVLLDRAFAVSPASVLQLDDLLTSEVRLNALGVFPSYRLDLPAHGDNGFDLQFQAQENNGFGNTKLQALLGVFRGLPYQEVTPEYYNIGKSATNWLSLLRWDAQKRRAETSLSGPFLRNPRWRYRIGVDLRDENWEIRKSFSGPAPILAGLNLRREELSAEIQRMIGSRLSWGAAAEFSHRDYRNVFSGSALNAALLTSGDELSERANLGYELLRLPERRLTIGGKADARVSRLLSGGAKSFEKIQGGVNVRWLPRAQGDDYETHLDVRAGDTFGSFPFDELFMLGVERDNDLWLRGHIGTRDGQKGTAPLGSRYVVTNWETDKNIYRNGIFTVKLGPFVDSGSIGGVNAVLGSQKWLWDTGVECKISVLGVGVSLIYGKDLRSGNNAFYTAVGR